MKQSKQMKDMKIESFHNLRRVIAKRVASSRNSLKIQLKYSTLYILISSSSTRVIRDFVLPHIDSEKKKKDHRHVSDMGMK